MKERKVRQSKYGEPTVVVRVPVSMLPAVQDMLKRREVIEEQWKEASLPPQAQRFLDLITELMITPQKGLIQALKETGLPGFHDEIKKLTTDLIEYRKACNSLTVDVLLEVLGGEQ